MIEDDLKDEDNLKNEDDLKMKTTPKNEKSNISNIVGFILHYLRKLLIIPHLDSNSTTDPKPEMLLAV